MYVTIKEQSGMIVFYFIVGVDNVGGIPVPIPNTEVKPDSAENTWLETIWENR